MIKNTSRDECLKGKKNTCILVNKSMGVEKEKMRDHNKDKVGSKKFG